MEIRYLKKDCFVSLIEKIYTWHIILHTTACQRLTPEIPACLESKDCNLCLSETGKPLSVARNHMSHTSILLLVRSSDLGHKLLELEDKAFWLRTLSFLDKFILIAIWVNVEEIVMK